MFVCVLFFFKQKTAYEMRISDWSSDACSSDLEPACHFELDPAVLLDAHRRARNGGPRVVGHYHSHPSGKAVPSSIDAECAAPDGSLWLIVADAQARLWRAVANGPLHGQFRAETMEDCGTVGVAWRVKVMT